MPLARRAFLRGALALITAPHRTAAGQATPQLSAPTLLHARAAAPQATVPATGRRSNALPFVVAA